MVGILSLLCVCLFVCTVTDLQQRKKIAASNLRVLVRLLSEMSFSNFSELWPRGGPQPRMRAPYGEICVLLTHLFSVYILASDDCLGHFWTRNVNEHSCWTL